MAKNIDSFEFEGTNIRDIPDIVHVGGDIYAIVYGGADNDGFLATVTIDYQGNITAAVIDSVEFDTDNCSAPKILHISGTIYAIVYLGTGADLQCKTWSIAADGNIAAAATDTLDFGTGDLGGCDFIHVSGTVYAVVHPASGQDGYVRTFTIAGDGSIGAAAIDSFEFETAGLQYPRLIHISGTIYAIVYRSSSISLKTLDIANNGIITAAAVDSLTFGAVITTSAPDIVKVSGDIYAIAFTSDFVSGQFNSNTGVLATVEIDSTGYISNAVVDAAYFDSYFGYYPRMLLLASNTVGIVYYPTITGARQALARMTVSDAGVISGNPNTFNGVSVDGLAIDAVDGGFCEIIRRSGDIYIIVYQGVDDDGFVATFDIQTTDTSARRVLAPGLYGNFWAWVDWDDDGSFAGTYDNISADVIDIPQISYGVNRELEETVSASLQLVVNNATHKYSPPNTSSVLNTGGNTLRAGHRIMAGMSFPFDDFIELDGIEIESHAVPYDNSFSWSQKSGAFEIDTNKVKETGGVGGIAVLDFGEADAHVAVKFTKGADDDCILVLRYSDTSNYIYVRTTATDLELRKVVAGVDSLIDGEALAWTVGTTKIVKAILHGPFIWVLVDLVQVLPAIRRTSGALLNDSFNQTETKHGIGGSSIHADARYDDFGGVYSLFYGTIDKIQPAPSKERQTATIEASDDMKELAQAELHRRAYAYAGYPAGMKAYLEQITANIPSIPQLGELFDWGENVDVNPYKSWWGISALDVCRNIERDENGLFYQDQDGLWRFEAKGHRAAAPHDAAKCVFYGDYATNGLGFNNLKWVSGEDDVKNLIAVAVQRSEPDPLNPVEVWRCAEADVVDLGTATSTVELAAGESIVLYMESQEFDTVDTLISPAGTTDYKANAAANGSGTDKTAFLAVALAYPFYGSYGKGAKITLTNSDAAAIFVTRLRVRGDGYRLQPRTSVLAEDTTSQSTYHTHTHKVDAELLVRRDEAQTLADDIKTKEANPRAMVQIELGRATKQTLTKILSLKISDRITLNYSPMGLNEDFYVNKIEYSMLGLAINCLVTLEEVS